MRATSHVTLNVLASPQSWHHPADDLGRWVAPIAVVGLSAIDRAEDASEHRLAPSSAVDGGSSEPRASMDPSDGD